jgi:uncharacterized FAD-dependent dehydrogenase
LALLVSNVASDGEGDPTMPLCRALGINKKDLISWELVRKSLDARHGKHVWRSTWKVEVNDEAAVLKYPGSARPWTERDAVRFGFEEAKIEATAPAKGRMKPIIVGAGPAGLFAALYLAEAGHPGVLLDRGQAVDGRVKAVNGFWRNMLPLDPDNNLLFGEGGAGTFSDGKIYTRRRDGDLGWIFRRFVDFGADPGILHDAWAHLGTDKVRAVLPVFRARLAELGVDVRYGAKVVGLVKDGGRVTGVRLADDTVIEGSMVIVGAGHSARDAMAMMVEAGAAAESRPIAVGARIEHPQALIDKGRYHVDDRGELPAASYRLAFNPSAGRAAHTFCMCPGGMVVPAMHHGGSVVVNGMSFSTQRGFFANSAVIVDVSVDDYGAADPLAGYRWQEAIERRAFDVAEGTFRTPAQRVVDFLAGRPSDDVGKVSYPMGVVPGSLDAVLPPAIVAGMREAILDFGRKIPGFSDNGVLMAPETRTTSPVRLLRTAGGESTTLPGLFPIGEGAGYGGGIISCAFDGMRTAKAIVGA